MQELKNKDGTIRSYREEIYLFNGQRITKTFKRKSDAKKWKQIQFAQIERNEALGIKTTPQITFKEFAARWLQIKVKDQRAISTYHKYQSVLRKYIFPLLGNLLLTEIKVSHADELVSFLKRNSHNEQGINIILGVVKTALNEAVRQEYLVKSPFYGYKKMKLPPQKEIYWTELEIAQFLRANINNPLYPLYVLALNTGMRRGELAGLCWDRIDFKNNQIEVTRTRDNFGLRDTTKTGHKRIIPLSVDARETLANLLKKQISLQFVFCNTDGTPIDVHHLDRHFKRAQKDAGFERQIHFHALRHTFASHFMMRGGNIYDLQKILGHTRTDMTQRYSHLAPHHLAKAMQIISFNGHSNCVDSQVITPDFGRKISSRFP
jgi:integrase